MIYDPVVQREQGDLHMYMSYTIIMHFKHIYVHINSGRYSEYNHS